MNTLHPVYHAALACKERVIPRQALLAGSIRTTHKADQVHLHEALRRVVESTAAVRWLHGA